MEYARSICGIRGADHAESNPLASDLVISRLSCSLAGTQETIIIYPDTQAYQIYGCKEAVESYHCNYSLNPEYHDRLFQQGLLKISGVNNDGAIRMIELQGHPFFVASLFLPQMNTSNDSFHPLIAGFLKAAVQFRLHR